MSLTLLLEKYDVSTEEGLQKALSEIEKEESEVNEALAGVLSRACSLEGRMRTASQAYAKLNDVKGDAQLATDMVEKTAGLARDVSAKVRQLDLARSRVAECQRRVHDLIDLQLCSAGVEAAIKAHDYETGAAHVARFLSMDEGSVAAARARGAADPRDSMARAADTLREHLVRKFEEAARKQDEAGVERLLQLFPQIGRADEGVALLAKFLATQLESTLRRDCTVSESASEGVPFASAFSRLVQAAGATVERARRAASARLPSALAGIQPTVCAGGRRLYRELVAARRLGAGRRTGDPLAAEPLVAELAQVHATIQLYFAFLVRKTEADAAELPVAAKQTALAATNKLIAECDLTRTAQEVLGHYLELERYFLEESVNKALKLATPQAGATTSSLVDDVFYITKKVIRRSISTGSVDGACCVLNEAASLLERTVAGALRRWVRAPPADPLPLAPPPAPAHPAPLDPAALLSNRFNRDQDAQNALFLAHLNEAESGAEWSERLATEAVAAGEAAGLARTAAAREKLASCAGGLGGAAAAFRAAHDLALAGLHAALKPRLLAWAEFIADPATDDEELEDTADALPAALDSLAERARAALSVRAADATLVALVLELAARAEARLLHHYYDRESGSSVERRCRRLAAWAGGNAAGARERCARLTQAGALLALERAQHAPQALHPAARLAPDDVRLVLARRTDFKMEEIKRLKL